MRTTGEGHQVRGPKEARGGAARALRRDREGDRGGVRRHRRRLDAMSSATRGRGGQLERRERKGVCTLESE